MERRRGNRSGWQERSRGEGPSPDNVHMPREALVPDLSPCREAANTGKKSTSQGFLQVGAHIAKGLSQRPLPEEENPIAGMQICKGVTHMLIHMQ